MITFLQKAIYPKNDTFAETTDPAKATHFKKAGGGIQPISEYKQHEQTPAVSNAQPLVPPVMNFGEKEQERNDGMSDFLIPPSLNFEPLTKLHNTDKQQVINNDVPSPLVPPVCY